MRGYKRSVSNDGRIEKEEGETGGEPFRRGSPSRSQTCGGLTKKSRPSVGVGGAVVFCANRKKQEGRESP